MPKAKILGFLFIVFLTLGVLVSCALDPYGGDKASIQIDLSQITQADPGSMGMNLNDHGDVGTMTLPDAQLTNFDCYAINVVGPGIASSGNGNENIAERLSRMYQGSSCAYPGVTSAPFRKDGASHSISLTVPSGERRIIQVVGIIDPTGLTCNNPNPVGSQGGDAGAHAIVEIARVQTDLFSSKTITPPNEWASFANSVKRSKLVDCGGDVVYDPSPLKPEGIPGIIQWHEAHQFAGCSNTGPIGTWGNTAGNDMTGNTGTACKVDSFGSGLHGMWLLGAATGYFTPPSAYVGTALTGFTQVLLMKMGSTSSTSQIFKHTGTTADFVALQHDSTANTYTATIDPIGVAKSVTLDMGASDVDRAAIHVIRWGNADTFSYTIFPDDLQPVNGTNTPPTGIILDSDINFGHLGSAGAEFFLAEALMYPRNLLPREVRALVRYLAIKYRLKVKFSTNF